MNRFLISDREFVRAQSSLFPGVRPRVGRAQTKKTKCKQFSELEVEPDEFVLDVLEFFFDERLRPEQLNDPLRELAARVVHEARKSSKAMDLVPRPPGWKPSYLWLVSQAVQIAFRKEQNKCIYEAVRVNIKRNFRSEYVMLRDGVMGQSIAMQAPMKTSSKGIELIKGFESFRSDLYDGPAGNCHIGYGHMVHSGACNGTESEEFQAGITEARATQLLAAHAAQCEQFIASNVTVPLSQCQFDALVSFCFNVGVGNFKGSTLLRKLNQGDHAAVPVELKKWVRGGGKVLPGLQRRRAIEADLYENCTYPAKAGSQSLSEAAVDADSMDRAEREDGVHLASMSFSTSVPSFCAANAAETAGTAHFALSEFACKDGTEVPESLRGHVQELMEQLEVLRAELGGSPITVLSGYRTPAWNERVEGAARSRHLCAQAADIRVEDHTPSQVHATIERLIGEGRMRQGGLGSYRTFTHYDTRGTRARW